MHIKVYEAHTKLYTWWFRFIIRTRFTTFIKMLCCPMLMCKENLALYNIPDPIVELCKNMKSDENVFNLRVSWYGTVMP